MDFLRFLFFRFLHQTSAVSPPLAVAETKTTEGNLAGSWHLVRQAIRHLEPQSGRLGA